MASQVVGLQCTLIIIILTSCFLGYCMARKEYSYQSMVQRYKSNLVQELINQINAQDLVTVGRTYASNKRTTDDLLDDNTRLFRNRNEIPDYDSNKLMLDDNSINHLRRRNIDEDRSDLTPVSNYHQRPVVADSRSSPWTLERPSKYCTERYYVPGPSGYSFICRDTQMVGATNKQLMATLPGEPTKAESRRLLLDLKNYFNSL